MTNKYRYFIGNWKMFGDFSSLKIINSINNYIKSSKTKSKYNRVIFCVPNILINHFSNKPNKSNISIGAQNSHQLNDYGPYTGSINSKMIKSAGAKFLILGHSENRREGETDSLINKKIRSAIKNNLTVIFCIGETLRQKRKNTTNKILSKQIETGLKKIENLQRIIVAYEPVWSIGTGIIPRNKELIKTLSFIRNKLNKSFKNKSFLRIIYGGSVNSKNIGALSTIPDISGFLIGGASTSAKKFIDIMKNCYM